MGPTDFVDERTNPEDAINDILDFFFGDPTRMKRKEKEEIKLEERPTAPGA